MEPSSTRRGFFAAATVAALSLAVSDANAQLPGKGLGLRARAFHQHNRAENLAQGIKELTPEDSQLAAKLRPEALRLVEQLVKDKNQRWEMRDSVNGDIRTRSYVTTVALEQSGALEIQLYSDTFPGAAPNNNLRLQAQGSDRSLTIRGGGPMEGVRALMPERKKVDQLYAEVSRR